MATYWIDPYVGCSSQGNGTTDTSTRDGTYAAPFSFDQFVKTSEWGTDIVITHGDGSSTTTIVHNDDIKIKGLPYTTLFSDTDTGSKCVIQASSYYGNLHFSHSSDEMTDSQQAAAQATTVLGFYESDVSDYTANCPDNILLIRGYPYNKTQNFGGAPHNFYQLMLRTIYAKRYKTSSNRVATGVVKCPMRYLSASYRDFGNAGGSGYTSNPYFVTSVNQLRASVGGTFGYVNTIGITAGWVDEGSTRGGLSLWTPSTGNSTYRQFYMTSSSFPIKMDTPELYIIPIRGSNLGGDAYSYMNFQKMSMYYAETNALNFHTKLPSFYSYDSYMYHNPGNYSHSFYMTDQVTWNKAVSYYGASNVQTKGTHSSNTVTSNVVTIPFYAADRLGHSSFNNGQAGSGSSTYLNASGNGSQGTFEGTTWKLGSIFVRGVGNYADNNPISPVQKLDTAKSYEYMNNSVVACGFNYYGKDSYFPLHIHNRYVDHHKKSPQARVVFKGGTNVRSPLHPDDTDYFGNDDVSTSYTSGAHDGYYTSLPICMTNKDNTVGAFRHSIPLVSSSSDDLHIYFLSGREYNTNHVVSAGTLTCSSANYATTDHKIYFYKEAGVIDSQSLPNARPLPVLHFESNDYDGKPIGLIPCERDGRYSYPFHDRVALMYYNDSSNFIVFKPTNLLTNDTISQVYNFPIELTVPSYTQGSNNLRLSVTLSRADVTFHSNDTCKLSVMYKDSTQTSDMRVNTGSAFQISTLATSTGSPTTKTQNLTNLPASGQTKITSVIGVLTFTLYGNSTTSPTNAHKVILQTATIETY